MSTTLDETTDLELLVSNISIARAQRHPDRLLRSSCRNRIRVEHRNCGNPEQHVRRAQSRRVSRRARGARAAWLQLSRWKIWSFCKRSKIARTERPLVKPLPV
jgi:hypothetical protein